MVNTKGMWCLDIFLYVIVSNILFPSVVINPREGGNGRDRRPSDKVAAQRKV